MDLYSLNSFTKSRLKQTLPIITQEVLNIFINTNIASGFQSSAAATGNGCFLFALPVYPVGSSCTGHDAVSDQDTLERGRGGTHTHNSVSCPDGTLQVITFWMLCVSVYIATSLQCVAIEELPPSAKFNRHRLLNAKQLFLKHTIYPQLHTTMSSLTHNQYSLKRVSSVSLTESEWNWKLEKQETDKWHIAEF